MEKKLIKSPIQKEEIEKPENPMENIMEKSGMSTADVFVKAIIASLRGEKGPKGEKGEKGENGKDYKLTEMDKRVIANLAYEIVADQVDSSIEEATQDVLAVIEGKLQDTVKKTFSDNKSMIEGIVAERFKKLATEQNRGLESIKSSLLKEVSTESKKMATEGKRMSQSMKDEIVAEYKIKLSQLIEEINNRKISWSDIEKRPNIVTGLAHLVDVDTTGATSSNKVLKPVFDSNGNLTGFAFGDQSGGGGSSSVETPSGTINGSNTSFTVSNEPKWIIADGVTYFEGAGYSYSAGTLTIDTPPVSFIRSIY